MEDFQFYPTPPDLARRAWRKFKNTSFTRVLEPSAGTGDLATGHPNHADHWRREIPIDVCELDMGKHPILRGKRLNVVGSDFLKMTSGALYSHIVLNPPFAEGARHVLKAWDILWDGEIVAILNAETIRNPFSRERQFLVDLIEKHGEVEFIEGAFIVPEAERKTSVDVALVWLKKSADVANDIVGDLLSNLKKDETEESVIGGYQAPHELALPNSFVENSVRAFNAALKAMRDAVFAQAKANYYASILGDTMAVRNGDGATERADTSVEFVQNTVAKQYLELKDRAWASVLRSTNVTSRLSSAAQRRVESEFEEIKKFEFTIENIYGFLCGIVESQGDIQISMVCDVFDLITKYHTDNTVFYKSYRGNGWKSNDKHRTCGMRIKTTRFILPGHGTDGWRSSLSWESTRLLDDFDKVFALVDGGKHAPAVSLNYVFNHHFNDLRSGKRVSSSYFDVRYYPGAGTIHFFPKDKKLIDRFNRLVGQHRQWIPPSDVPVSDAFWLQYQEAEKFDKEFRAEVKKKTTSWWNSPLDKMMHTSDSQRNSEGFTEVNAALDTVLERHGISVDFQLENTQPGKPLLLAA